MNLDLIKNNTKWEEAANSINSNFNKTNLELTKIAASSVKHKGYFTTEAALLAAQPSPKVGDNAYVGATYPGVVYICNTAGMWTATTTVPSPPAVNISEYYKKTETDAIVATVESNINSLEIDLNEVKVDIFGTKTISLSSVNMINGYSIKGSYYGSSSGGLRIDASSKISIYAVNKDSKYSLQAQTGYGSSVAAIALYSDIQCLNLIEVIKSSADNPIVTTEYVCSANGYIGMPILNNSTINVCNEIVIETLQKLNTVAKESIVSAINEVNTLSSNTEARILSLENITTSEAVYQISPKETKDGFYVNNTGLLVGYSASKVDIFEAIYGKEYNLKGNTGLGSNVSGIAVYEDAQLTIKKAVIWTSAQGSAFDFNYTATMNQYIVISYMYDYEPIVTTTKIVSKTSKFLDGYDLYSIGDSLSTSGIWQNKVAELTGCNFNNSINNKSGQETSIGGMSSYGNGFFNSLWRTKNLISQNVIDDDSKAIIIFENANDAWTDQLFDLSATTYIPTEPIDCGLESGFNSSVLLGIASEQRSLNSIIKLERIVNGTNVHIDNLPTKEGNVKLNITMINTGSKSYSIHVIPQASAEETLSYVLNKILEYEYAGCNDTLASDSESVNFSEAGSGAFNPTITFEDTDNTGMAVTISITNDARTALAYYYNGNTVNDNDWSNTSNWQLGISFSSGIKSSIELIKRTYPNAHIIMSMFPIHSDKVSNYLLSKGVYDSFSYYNSQQQLRNRKLNDAYKSVSNLYKLPYCDVYNDCGIDISNMSAFYYDNNVHPKDNGYRKFGEVIAAELTKYIK